VWALAAPSASNTREIKREFNVFKENLHSTGISGAERASPDGSTRYATAHHSTKIMNRLDDMSRPDIEALVLSITFAARRHSGVSYCHG
jgi:hypothetical protein